MLTNTNDFSKAINNSKVVPWRYHRFILSSLVLQQSCYNWLALELGFLGDHVESHGRLWMWALPRKKLVFSVRLTIPFWYSCEWNGCERWWRPDWWLVSSLGESWAKPRPTFAFFSDWRNTHNILKLVGSTAMRRAQCTETVGCSWYDPCFSVCNHHIPMLNI